MLRDDRSDGGRKPLPARNVLGEPIEICSLKPMTGFFRDGCCNTGPQDLGSHTVCVVMTAEFLEFSTSRGNDLSTPVPEFGFPGLKPGDRWCLCAPPPAGGTRGEAGASRGLARYPRGRTGLLLARRSKAPCNGPSVARHYISAMCGRVIQSSAPIRLAIVDGLDVRDSRVHNYPPRWNGAPSQELLVIRRNHQTGELSLDPCVGA